MITFPRHLSRTFKQLRCISNSPIISSEKSESDEKNEKNLKKEDASKKLNNLLKLMIEQEDGKPDKSIPIALAVKRQREKPVKAKPLGEKLAEAAKDVASTLGGDSKKTESELLNILLRPSDTTQGLKDVLAGIKVQKTDPESRAEQVRRRSMTLPDRRSVETGAQMSTSTREIHKPKKKSVAQVDIMCAPPTSYFKDFQPAPAACELRTWQACVQKDLRLAVTHPPTNIYEQMILWTDRSMLWQFPIDNEQGLDDERKVSFEDHIFLENHLEGWCPDKGPIRHFMELVCVGLSKNHYLTVEEKKNHIFWYRDYFADKKSLLKELGAGTIGDGSENQAELTQ